ncbi:histone-fold-containing protein, partial [Sphaerulina musiva SO2202]
KRRTKPSVAALREIRRYQKTTELLIRRLLFQRICREVTIDIANQAYTPLRIQASALGVLQEYAESLLVRIFTSANLLAIYAKRVTLQGKDMECLRSLLKEWG